MDGVAAAVARRRWYHGSAAQHGISGILLLNCSWLQHYFAEFRLVAAAVLLAVLIISVKPRLGLPRQVRTLALRQLLLIPAPLIGIDFRNNNAASRCDACQPPQAGRHASCSPPLAARRDAYITYAS